MTFDWVAASMKMVLALGMTRLLTSAVLMYRLRRRYTFDWVPATWAATVFLSQLQFSWALASLGEGDIVWTFGSFLALFGLAVIVYVSGALVLPDSASESAQGMRDSFNADGQMGLLFLSAYELLTLAANWYFWGSPPTTLVAFMNLALAGLAFGCWYSSNRRVESAATIAFASLFVIEQFIVNAGS
jgi:hypothetical protein